MRLTQRDVYLQASNPFVFKHVQHLTGALDDSGPCVVMATPSMLQVATLQPIMPQLCC